MPRPPRTQEALRSLITSEDRHGWSVADLRDRLAAGGLTVDYSTVFRAVEQLARDRVVERLELLDGHVHYERQYAHHDHLWCERCGAVAPVPCMLVSQVLADVAAATGFEIREHRLVIAGVCATCAGPGERPGPKAR